MVGLLRFCSLELVLADFACLYLCGTSVPLQTTLPPDDLAFIINHTELETIVCSARELETLKHTLPKCPGVRSLVVIDTPSWEGTTALPFVRTSDLLT